MKSSFVSPEELTKLANKVVSDKLLDNSMKSKHFREFIRVFTFMLMNTAEGETSGNFGHFLIMRNSRNKPVSIDIEIKFNVDQQ